MIILIYSLYILLLSLSSGTLLKASEKLKDREKYDDTFFNPHYC